MTGLEIKAECELQYQRIKNANESLEELRKMCKHEETYEGDYSWRIGESHKATICSYCGQVLSNPILTIGV